jgi:hypothetical protein
MYDRADPALSNLTGVGSMTHVRSKQKRISTRVGGTHGSAHLSNLNLRTYKQFAAHLLIGFEITIRARRKKSTFFAP